MAHAQDGGSNRAASSPIEEANIRIAAGLFPDLPSAKDAVTELKAAEFTDKEIGLAMRSPAETESTTVDVTGTRAPEEAATGAVGGVVLGGLAGLLVAAGVVAIPGVGPLLAGGSLALCSAVRGRQLPRGPALARRPEA
jgi:hypothetical protein